MTLSSYLIALGLTLLIETSVAVIFDSRSWKLLRCVVLVNLVSHPIFGFTIWLLLHLHVPVGLPLILGLEGVIVLVEAGLLMLAMPERPKAFLFWLSLCMNATSYGIGVLIFGA